MTMIILSFYVMFSSVQNVLIENIMSKENIFIIIFLLWSIIVGMNCVDQIIVIDFSSCIPQHYVFSIDEHLDLGLFEILILQQCVIIFLQERRKNDAMRISQPEIFYIHNSVSIQNIPSQFDDMNKSLRYLSYTFSIIFIIFWLPFFVVQFLYLIDETIVTYDLLVHLYFFGSMKGAVNPIAILIIYMKSRYLTYKLIFKFTRWEVHFD